MNAKQKAVLDRIAHLEDAIVKAHQHLENGDHAHWHGFRPLFDPKVRDGNAVSPHKDWVRNVFLPGREGALAHAREALERLG